MQSDSSFITQRTDQLLHLLEIAKKCQLSRDNGGLHICSLSTEIIYFFSFVCFFVCLGFGLFFVFVFVFPECNPKITRRQNHLYTKLTRVSDPRNWNCKPASGNMTEKS